MYMTPQLTPEENATYCVVLKIYIFINFYLKDIKLIITPQLPPGKIGKHFVVLKLLTCPAESVLTK